jgi:hypothetical protein
MWCRVNLKRLDTASFLYYNQCIDLNGVFVMKQVVKTQIIAEMQSRFGAGSVITKAQVLEASEKFTPQFPSFFFLTCEKAGRGKYIVPGSTTTTPTTAVEQPPEAVVALSPNTIVSNMNVQTAGFTENLIPEKDPLFVPFGNFATVKDVIGSKLFYPMFITGLSGNGKTFSVEQACAASLPKPMKMT